jgi:tape measure domain-containing protein
MAQSINIGIIFNANNRTGNVLSSINGQVNRLESRVQNFNSKVNSLFSIGNMMGVGAGLGFLKLGADMEQTNVAFKVMLGSADEATKVLNKLNNFSNVTPFQNKEVIQAGRNLIAFGIEADKVESVMQRVGDVASGVKMPFTELSEIYGKIKVGNTAYNEDLNQLAGRGIPIFTELAKVMKVPEDQIKKLSSEGKITFREIDQAFINMTSAGGKYAGMMDEMSKTGAGAWSTAVGKLTDGVTKLSVSIMPVMTDMLTGVIPIIDKVNELTQAHPELFKNILMVGGGLMGLNVAGKVFGVIQAGALVASSGILQPIAGISKIMKVTHLLNMSLAAGKMETYSALIQRYGMAGRIAAGGIWLKNQAVTFGTFIGKLFNAETRKATLLQLWNGMVSKAQAAWTWALSVAQKVAAGATWLWNRALSASKFSLTGVIASTWAWTAALLANPITWIVAAILALVAGIALAWKHFDWFRGGIVGAWEAVKKFGQILWESIINPIKLMIAGVGKLIDAFGLLKKGEWKAAGATLKSGFGDIGKGMVQSTPVGVAMNVVKRSDEMGEAWNTGYQRGKDIDTSNFLSFGNMFNRGQEQPVSANDMQVPVINMTPTWLPETTNFNQPNIKL